LSQYIPLDGKPFRLAMGLRPLDPANWFEVDPSAAAELDEKRRLVRERRSEVVGLLDSCLPAALELHAMVGDYISSTPENATDHPLVEASLLVPDDLCIMERANGAWRLSGAVVAFPSRWYLAEKIGRTLDVIHDVVPGYATQLGAPVNAFFDRMTPQRPVWRLNWSLVDSPDLFLPPSHRQPLDDVEEWFFRVERQTLRVLPKTGAIVFSIRTYVQSLEQLLARDSDHGRALLLALDTAPLATLEYKGWVGVADRLRGRLTAN
jgi:dimethylamine monooxygenase subunit A